jgi:alanyl-tRNA synthetase
MRNLSGNQIREDFLRFFEGKGHRRVHSSSLVPVNDPTLLFTNAGMNQFKDVFLGAETREYSRAASSQKCVRAGGKHNDLENVGFTRRHHTFFEMLGNFSFGDYFKKDAIAFAWELLTSPDWFGIDKSKLYVTIFEGQGTVPRDDEAERLWMDVGVPKDRIFEMGMKDNFWQMGDTGPCGPCSEIFFDLGLAASETGEDKPFPEDDQRYMEIWNLVFMQFDRSSDGVLTPLPKPSIDTGMGLERVACVLQGKLSNYESDLFTPLLKRAAELTGFVSELSIDELAVSDVKGAASLRIIADHARASTFLISDGVTPANEGRGYVLRKILRRGIRHGRLLGQEKPFMHEMVLAVRDEMIAAYPELGESAERVAKVVLAEEEQFARVMAIGTRKLELALAIAAQPQIEPWIEEVSSGMSEDQKLALDIYKDPKALLNLDSPGASLSFVINVISSHFETDPNFSLSGREAFRLYETFGLPFDYIVDTARDFGFTVDEVGFEKAKEEEQARARASWKGGSQKSASPIYKQLAEGADVYAGMSGVLPEAHEPYTLNFVGYSSLKSETRVVAVIWVDPDTSREYVRSLAGPSQLFKIVLEDSPFYATSGGQVGDVGEIRSANGNEKLAEVLDCESPFRGVRVLTVKVLVGQQITAGQVVTAVVDGAVRAAVMRNHTGTHLLHAALRQVLGTHVKQAGSLNDRSRLRFDFSHFAGVAEEELQEIESIVNAQVLANTPVVTLVDVPIDVAVHELGAMALFGEKYGDKVRVVKIGEFSTELCGGTHTAATGEIGLVKLMGEGAVASGVRRMEAVTGMGALGVFRRDADVARVAGQFVGGGEVSGEALRARVSAQEEEMKKLRRELEAMRMKSASAATADAASSAVDVKGVKVLSQRVDALDKSQMRNLVDELRGKLGSGVVVLGAVAEGRVSLIVGVSKDLVGRVQAGKIVGAIAAKVGGKGGGRPDLAEAGGSDVAGLDAALASAKDVVGDLLG